MNNNDTEKTQIRNTSAKRISVLRYNSLSPTQVHGGKGRRVKQGTDYGKQSPGQGLAADSLYDNAEAGYHFQYIFTGDVGVVRPCGDACCVARGLFLRALEAFSWSCSVGLSRCLQITQREYVSELFRLFTFSTLFFLFFHSERRNNKEIKSFQVCLLYIANKGFPSR